MNPDNPEPWTLDTHKHLLHAASSIMRKQHLRVLLMDEERNRKLIVESPEGVIADFSRQKVTTHVVEMLLTHAREAGLEAKIASMFKGEHINVTENRAALHVALRCHRDDPYTEHSKVIVKDVHHVLDQIQKFSDRIRSGELKGHTGKDLTDIICVGIGGSYLGPEFVYEALRTHKECANACHGRRLRFLANVDPIDVARATQDLNPETTLVIVISKTFITAETLLNARTLKKWLLETLKDESAIGKHMVAVSTNVKSATHFGILADNVFGFWDWVGGRFSVTSAVGILPLALHFGFPVARQFLDGCRAMDIHFKATPLEANIPVLMAAMSIWNSTYLGYEDVAVLPYCQALLRFPAHVQQLLMASNGKRVSINGTPLPHDAGEICFGEPGTNGQHSFYQLLHQGRTVPTEFIGFCHSQQDQMVPGEAVSSHDELMSNFFAQPNALAYGKSAEKLKAEGVPDGLIQHKVFKGDRPSTVLLFSVCNPYTVGLLLALYEHRAAVQGFIWNVNPFDQWGVELAKVSARNVREILAARRNKRKSSLDSKLPSSTAIMIEKYMSRK